MSRDKTLLLVLLINDILWIYSCRTEAMLTSVINSVKSYAHSNINYSFNDTDAGVIEACRSSALDGFTGLQPA